MKSSKDIGTGSTQPQNIVVSFDELANNTDLIKPFRAVQGPHTKVDKSEIRPNSVWMSFTSGDTLEFTGDTCCDQCRMVIDHHSMDNGFAGELCGSFEDAWITGEECPLMPGHKFHVLHLKMSRGTGIYAGHDFKAKHTVKADALKYAGEEKLTDRQGVAQMIRNISSLGYGEKYQRESMARFLGSGKLENFGAYYELCP